jgi:U6 snRNA-associated Sm-like protein LSm7
MKWRSQYKVIVLLTPVHPHRLTRILAIFSDPEPRIRILGLAVLRGPTITLLSPVDGLEEISNPFIAQD